MEIKTNLITEEGGDFESGPPPEKSQYLRRKTTQKLRRSRGINHILLLGLRILGVVAAWILMVGSLVALIAYVYASDRFLLRNIQIVGGKHIESPKLEEIIRQSFPKRILQINLRQVRDRLEQEPWIHKVEIRRILPSDMVLYVYERTPSVILELGGELMLADNEGILLDKYELRYGKLDTPVFRGLLGDTAENYRHQQSENSERVRLGLKMLAELESGSSAFTRNISEIDLSDKSNLRLLLVDDTAEVMLGNKDFLKRFRTLINNSKQYEELKARYREFASVDLRYDGQIVYRPRQNASPTVEQTAEARP